MLRRKPINRVSARAKSWVAYKRREHAEVMGRQVLDGRDSRWVCEGCFKSTYQLQVAHIFGRRNIVGEPWASSRYLTMKLCYYSGITDLIGCHEKIDQYKDPELRNRLADICARRLYLAFDRPYPELLDPIGAVRQISIQAIPEEARIILHVA